MAPQADVTTVFPRADAVSGSLRERRQEWLFAPVRRVSNPPAVGQSRRQPVVPNPAAPPPFCLPLRSRRRTNARSRSSASALA